jgi:4-carboxymuconolactone decarboxylase
MDSRQHPPFGTTSPSRRRHAVLVSAALIKRQDEQTVRSFKEALDHAFTVSELVELILQSLLFDGYPCALEGLILLKTLPGIVLDDDENVERYTPENVVKWLDRGEALCRSIYGENFSRLLRNVEELSPSLKAWMLYEGYGRVLARPALPIDIREMGIIAILTVKGFPRQLHSHLRGALRVGVPYKELEEAIALCADYTSPDRLGSAVETLKKLG